MVVVNVAGVGSIAECARFVAVDVERVGLISYWFVAIDVARVGLVVEVVGLVIQAIHMRLERKKKQKQKTEKQKKKRQQKSAP